jgi:hypothetical protein
MLNLMILCNIAGRWILTKQDDCHLMGVKRRIIDLKIDHV